MRQSRLILRMRISLGEHLGEIAGKISVRPLFLLVEFFLFGRSSSYRWWRRVLWHLWIGRARHPGTSTSRLSVVSKRVAHYSW